MKKTIFAILVIVLMTVGVIWLYLTLPGGADKVQPTETEETEIADTSVQFEEIYHEYKSNELRAKEKYYDNRYNKWNEYNRVAQYDRRCNTHDGNKDR